MKELNIHKLSAGDHLITPADYEELTLKSSALNIFSDFKKFRPLVIDANTKAIDAHVFMERTHVDYKIVINENSECLGIISLEDLSDQRLIKQVSQGLKRSNILVSDLMEDREQIYVFEFQDLENVCVRDVIEVLKQNGLQFCLVVDNITHEIRGIISANEIARRLRIAYEPNKPPSFAEIFEVIHQ